MTIREKIIENEITMLKERVEALKCMNMPACMFEGAADEIEKLEAGILAIGGDTSLLDAEYVSGEVKRGRGGKQYVQINGCINFFPKAKYGRYICANA